MNKLREFFNPTVRKAIYVLVGAAATVLLAFGIITQEQLDSFTQNAAAVIAALTALLAALNVNHDE